MTVVSKQVSASSDDCLIRAGSTPLFQFVNPTAGDVSSSNFGYQGGMRFLGFANSIKSATIFEATLTLVGAFLDGTLPPLEIIGEAKKDPATFVDKADFDARTRTTAKVAWNPSSWPLGSPSIVSVDFTSVINEILALWDGVSTDIVIFVQDTTPTTYGGTDNTRVGWQDFDDAPAGTLSAILTIVHTQPSVALSGTVVTAPPSQIDIRVGGKTIILTTNGTWAAFGASFDAQRQGIIDGIDSDQAESTGWDAIVKAGLNVTDVVRTSDTVVTIILPAFASYAITGTETITATIPTAAIQELLSPEVAAPTFDVTTVGTGNFGDLLDTQLIAAGGFSSVGEISHVRAGAVAGEDVFAIIYHIVSATDVVLATVMIDEAGNISSVIDTEVVNSQGLGSGPFPTIFKVSDGVVACCYTQQTAGLAEVKTYAIDNTGTITVTPLDTQSLGSTTASQTRIRKTNHPDMFMTTKQRFAISRFIELQTFTITSAGLISAVLDTQSIYTNGAGNSYDAAHVSGDLYCVAYQDNSSTNGNIATVTIDSGGLISTVIAALEYDNSHGGQPSLSSDGNGQVILMHEGSNPSQGKLRSLDISSDGLTITIDQTDTKSDANSSDILRIDQNLGIYLVAWSGNLLTVSVDNATGAISSIGGFGHAPLTDHPGMAFKPNSAVMAVMYLEGISGINVSTFGMQVNLDAPPAFTAFITGTIIPADETEVRDGGSTIVITLGEGALWKVTIGADNQDTQDLIDGLSSAQSEVAGWNAEVRDQLTFSDVNRDSDTVVTITLPAFPLYDTAVSETITVTVPDSALQ